MLVKRHGCNHQTCSTLLQYGWWRKWMRFQFELFLAVDWILLSSFCFMWLVFVFLLHLSKKSVFLCLPLLCRCYCHAGDIERGLQTFENHLRQDRSVPAELFVVSFGHTVSIPNLVVQWISTLLAVVWLVWVCKNFIILSNFYLFSCLASNI